MTRSIIIVAFLILSACKPITECPKGFALIPADDIYLKQPQCMAQFEMREINGKPVSTKDGKRWKLSHTFAKIACEESSLKLISNDAWQAMARNAEKVQENWEKGKIKTSVTLSNNEKLYNVGDGGWEQIETLLSNDMNINKLKIEQLRGVAKEIFGPKGIYTDAGLGITTTYKHPYIMRGGDDQDPGLFGVAFNHGSKAMVDDIGFRCVCSSRAMCNHIK